MKRNHTTRKGQSLIEYIALTALVAIVSISTVKALGTVVKKNMFHIQGQVSAIMKVGKVTPDTGNGNDDGSDDNGDGGVVVRRH